MRLRLGRAVALALILGAGLVPVAGAADEASVVAVVGGTPIPSEALDAAIQSELLGLRQREDQLRRQALNDLIAQVLFSREATARGVSVEEPVQA